MVDLLLSYNNSGLLHYRTLTEKTLQYYPYLLEWSCMTSESDILTERRFPVPEGVYVTEGATNIHGLTGVEGDNQRGESLHTLKNFIMKADRLVSYETDFLIETLEAEFMRAGYDDAIIRLRAMPVLSLMKYFTPAGEKYVKLDDRYEELCGFSSNDGKSATDKLLKIKGLYEKWIEHQS